MSRLLLSGLLLFFSLSFSQAQGFVWVFLDEKCPENPSTDHLSIPVCQIYINALAQKNIEVLGTSRWLNALVVSSGSAAELWEESFVCAIQEVQSMQFESLSSVPHSKKDMAYALEQMQGQLLQEAGLSGKGVKIGVIDGGFLGAHKNKSLLHLQENEAILGWKDFVSPQKKSPYEGSESNLDWHGTSVLQMIAGQDPKNKMQFGLAADAQFYLARTDHGKLEFRGEEYYWIAAMEWMDSLGVKLINTSLGYALGFDNPEENYSPEQMDGKTAVITQAAQIAVEERGMILIVSAGNDGDNKKWRVVSAPADAADVIAVGATKLDAWEKMPYSGIGPDWLKVPKPDVACFSSSGTSFSAPVITGLVACMLQKNPDLGPSEVRSILNKSAHLYPYPNNYLGYGVPKVERVLRLLQEPDWEPDFHSIHRVTGDSTTLRLSSSLNFITFFHKSPQGWVDEQFSLRADQNEYTIKRPEKSTRTTVAMGNKVMEIFWE